MVCGEHTRTQHAAESRTLHRCKLRQSICSLQALPPARLISNPTVRAQPQPVSPATLPATQTHTSARSAGPPRRRCSSTCSQSEGRKRVAETVRMDTVQASTLLLLACGHQRACALRRPGRHAGRSWPNQAHVSLSTLHRISSSSLVAWASSSASLVCTSCAKVLQVRARLCQCAWAGQCWAGRWVQEHGAWNGPQALRHAPRCLHAENSGICRKALRSSAAAQPRPVHLPRLQVLPRLVARCFVGGARLLRTQQPQLGIIHLLNMFVVLLTSGDGRRGLVGGWRGRGRPAAAVRCVCSTAPPLARLLAHVAPAARARAPPAVPAPAWP